MKKTKKIIALLTALVMSLMPLQASAVFECDVSVLRVLIYKNGNLNVLHSGRGEYTVICNVNSDYDGVKPATCVLWAGMLMAIKKKNGRANFYFNGDGTCAALPTYTSSPTPVYIGDVTP